MWRNILLVAAGGALGAVVRYMASRLIVSSWPWSTLAVNLLGSLLIGLLVGWAGRGLLSPEMKLLLVTGFCGGLTTFSTFANETFLMMKTGDILLATVYVGLSVAVGILAVWLGMLLSGALR